MDLKIVSPKKAGQKFVLAAGKIIGLMDKGQFISRRSFTTKQEESASLCQTRGNR